MKELCKCLGGSHAYGLNTPSSDIDLRGVFINDTVCDLAGVTKFEHINKIANEEDIAMYELKRFVNLLIKGNTTALEILFSDKWINIDPLFNELFICNRFKFVDSHKIFSCLSGYAKGEYELAIGNRKGVIGNKRADQIKLYGFSPKNFCQLFRLLHTGIHFFKCNEFIVDTTKFDNNIFNFLFSVKNSPADYTKDSLTELFIKLDNELKSAYNNRCCTNVFDYEYASIAILKLYLPLIQSHIT